MRNDRENLIVEKTFRFALEIIRFSEALRGMKKYEMASQLFRSGTSVGANVKEAQNAESKQDFIHKFKIACKECDETMYWLCLCKESPHYPDPEPKLINEIKEINKIISKIISTSKTRLKDPNY